MSLDRAKAAVFWKPEKLAFESIGEGLSFLDGLSGCFISVLNRSNWNEAIYERLKGTRASKLAGPFKRPRCFRQPFYHYHSRIVRP